MKLILAATLLALAVAVQAAAAPAVRVSKTEESDVITPTGQEKDVIKRRTPINDQGATSDSSQSTVKGQSEDVEEAKRAKSKITSQDKQKGKDTKRTKLRKKHRKAGHDKKKPTDSQQPRSQKPVKPDKQVSKTADTKKRKETPSQSGVVPVHLAQLKTIDSSRRDVQIVQVILPKTD